MNVERIAAQIAGQVKYTGQRPCRHCGGTVRYSRNGTCVACSRGHGGNDERAAVLGARATGSRIYTSQKPCPMCGDRIRRTRDQRCLTCSRAAERKAA